MEYLDNNHQAIGKSKNIKVDELKKDGRLTKINPQMSSFKFYVKKPTTVKKKKKIIRPAKKSKFTLQGVSLSEKMIFMDNMSTMLRAGLSLTPALKTLRQEIKNKFFKEILEYLEKHVENGQPLSQGMKHYPRVFSDMIVATVEVGENTGMLADTFGHLADILKRQKQLRSKVIGALMYPTIVLLAMVAVSGFLALVIFPQLVDLFESGGVELPFILKAVTSFNAFLENNGWYALGGFIIFVIGVIRIFKIPQPKLLLHTLILKVPFIGKLNKELSLTRFAGNLNALLAAGLSIVKSMEITAQTLGNLRYKKEIIEMSKELEKGESLEKTMSKRAGLFPSLTIQLCQVGETTGSLEEILGKIAIFYEDRVNSVLDNLSTILEPVLLIIVGIAVGFIAVSVISPMYELTNSFA